MALYTPVLAAAGLAEGSTRAAQAGLTAGASHAPVPLGLVPAWGEQERSSLLWPGWDLQFTLLISLQLNICMISPSTAGLQGGQDDPGQELQAHLVQSTPTSSAPFCGCCSCWEMP